MLVAMFVTSDKPWFYFLILATTGNWLGGITSYLIGRSCKTEWITSYLRVDHKKLETYESFIKKYGFFSALFCWVPFIGDPIAVALGWFRTPWHGVALFMLIGKIIRYFIISIPFI
jgi:membrane protein YqaA with SNARE-associated domain